MSRQVQQKEWLPSRDASEVEVYAAPADRVERVHPSQTVDLRPDEYQATQYKDRTPTGYNVERQRQETKFRSRPQIQEHEVGVHNLEEHEERHERQPQDYERHVTHEVVASPHGSGRVKQTKIFERQSSLVGGEAPHPHQKVKEVRREFERIRTDTAKERAGLLKRLQALENEERSAKEQLQQRDKQFMSKRRPIQEKIANLEQEQIRTTKIATRRSRIYPLSQGD